MKNISFLSLAVGLSCLSIAACAHTKLPPPASTPPPMHSTSGLGRNIIDLDKALQRAGSRAERISILIDALSDGKTVIPPIKK